VHRAAARAVESARTGAGPSLIECRTFRWRGHVGAGWDLDVGVARRGELAEWMDRDPIRRVEARIGAALVGPGAYAIEREIALALDLARHAPHPAPERALDFVYKEAAACGR
jgi:pyruvate dehydrogenase E1 component alpha subunit